MAADLVLFHDFNSRGDLLLPEGYWHLGTCLRSIVISDRTDRPKALEGYKVYRNEEAFEFLLQVVCGLHSPMIGETEIFGQFKSFIKTNQQRFSSSVQYALKLILKEAKAIRTEFLQNLGCTSYGSLLRKHVSEYCQPLTIVGAGALVSDILPWFVKKDIEINLITRTPDKHRHFADKYARVQLYGLDQLKEFTSGTLVIAAPVASDWINAQVKIEGFSQVFDLRGESKSDPLVASNLRSLQELFADIEQSRNQASEVKGFAMQAIQQSAARINHVEKLRPFGWDDLWV